MGQAEGGEKKRIGMQRGGDKREKIWKEMIAGKVSVCVNVRERVEKVSEPSFSTLILLCASLTQSPVAMAPVFLSALYHLLTSFPQHPSLPSSTVNLDATCHPNPADLVVSTATGVVM